MNKDTAFTVSILKAMSDETRLEIVKMLAGGEMCGCEILEQFDFTQPTLSYHMRLLTTAGLVNARREGAWIHYSLNREALKAMCGQFREICDAALTDERTDAETC